MIDMYLPTSPFGYACLFVAFGCWAATMFLYRDEEHRVHNKLVDWWVSVTEVGEGFVKKHILVTQAISAQSLRLIDWFFGAKAISFRNVWTLWMIAASSLWIQRLAIITLGNHTDVIRYPFGLVIILRALPWALLGSVPLAFVPAFLCRPLWQKRNLLAVLLLGAGASYLVPLLLWIPNELLKMLLQHHFKRIELGPYPYSILAGIALVSITRAVLRKALASQGYGTLILGALVVVPLVVIYVAYNFPITIAQAHFHGFNWQRLVMVNLAVTIMCNIALVFLPLGLVVATIFLALNVLFWPVISRLINAAHSHPPSRGQIAWLGVIFFTLAYSPSAWSLIKKRLDLPDKNDSQSAIPVPTVSAPTR